MKWKTLKTATEVKLDGIKTEIEWVNGQIYSVLLTDKSGNKLSVRYASYSFDVSVPAPKETEKKYVLSGMFKGATIMPITFDKELDAKLEMSNLLNAGADVNIEEKTVEVDE